MTCPFFAKTHKNNPFPDILRVRLSFIAIIGLGSYAAVQLVDVMFEDSNLSVKYADVGSNITENAGRSIAFV